MSSNDDQEIIFLAGLMFMLFILTALGIMFIYLVLPALNNSKAVQQQIKINKQEIKAWKEGGEKV